MLATVLTIIGALFLMYLAIRYFPTLVKLIVGVGVVLIIIFAFTGMVVVYLPVLIVVALILLVVKLIF